MKIQIADLLFFRPTGIVGKLICLVTRSEYCHVGMAEVAGDTVYIAEYRENGFRYIPLGDAEEEWGLNADVYRLEGITDIQKQSVLYHMKSSPWQGYGFWHFVMTGIVRLMPQWVGNALHWECERHKPHCSEAVCDAFRWGADTDLVPGKPDWQTAPGDIIKSNQVIKINHA